jgi:hypothetical protein
LTKGVKKVLDLSKGGVSNILTAVSTERLILGNSIPAGFFSMPKLTDIYIEDKMSGSKDILLYDSSRMNNNFTNVTIHLPVNSTYRLNFTRSDGRTIPALPTVTYINDIT